MCLAITHSLNEMHSSILINFVILGSLLHSLVYAFKLVTPIFVAWVNFLHDFVHGLYTLKPQSASSCLRSFVSLNLIRKCQGHQGHFLVTFIMLCSFFYLLQNASRLFKTGISIFLPKNKKSYCWIMNNRRIKFNLNYMT